MAGSKKLDGYVALHVLDWKNHEGKWTDSGCGTEVELTPFSTNIAAAFELAASICAKGFRLQIEGSRIWQARFYKSAAMTLETQAVAATGSTPAEAICLAALAAKGVDFP